MFNTCAPLDPNNWLDVATFMSTLMGNFQGVVQYNDDNRLVKVREKKNPISLLQSFPSRLLLLAFSFLSLFLSSPLSLSLSLSLSPFSLSTSPFSL
jgi:hypothetical protein